MPYAPTVNDHSGQILAQGMRGGVDSILAGMQQNAAARQKKEEEKRLQATLGPVIEQLSGGKIKLEDAPKEAWPMLFQAAQSEMQRPLRELQQRNAELENVLRSLEVQAAPGRIAAGTERAGMENELTRLELDAARNPAPSRVGTETMIGGQPFYWQNDKQVAPLPRSAGAGTDPQSALGKILADRDAAAARGDAGAVKLLEEMATNAAAGRSKAKELDDVTLMRWRGLEAQRRALLAQAQEQQAAMAQGDKRSGFLNMSSRQSALDDLLKQAAALKAQQDVLLARPGGAPSAEPTAKDGGQRTEGGGGTDPLDPDVFFEGL